jgi:N-acetylmuramoyl-L-alanine amidase
MDILKLIRERLTGLFSKRAPVPAPTPVPAPSPAPISPAPVSATRALVDPIKYTPGDLDISARTLWGEVRGEPTLGQIAVAWVIRNRVENPGWWGNTPTTVCLDPWQFSCWMDAQGPSLKALPTSDATYNLLYAIAKGVFSGTYVDPTKGASHYKVHGTVAQWDKAAAGKLTVSIGHHDFFKLGLNG